MSPGKATAEEASKAVNITEADCTETGNVAGKSPVSPLSGRDSIGVSQEEADNTTYFYNTHKDRVRSLAPEIEGKLILRHKARHRLHMCHLLHSLHYWGHHRGEHLSSIYGPSTDDSTCRGLAPLGQTK